MKPHEVKPPIWPRYRMTETAVPVGDEEGLQVKVETMYRDRLIEVKQLLSPTTLKFNRNQVESVVEYTRTVALGKVSGEIEKTA